MRELNTDPGVVSEVPVTYQFADATWEWESKSRDVMMLARSTTGVLMQYFDQSSGVYANPTEGTYGSMGVYRSAWTDYYERQVGNRLNEMVYYIDNVVSELRRPDYADMRAIANILQVQSLWRLADVYGAVVWKEAFRSNEGILTPKYDLIQDIYKDFDDIVKAQVDILKVEVTSSMEKLNEWDYFYGWTSTPNAGGGATLVKRSDYPTQRALWAKFGSVLRIKMAWRFKAKDPSHFSSVMTNVMADATNNLFQDYSEGCYYYYQSEYTENSDDISQFGQNSVLTDNFVHFMKTTNDPRLPLLGRYNWLDPNVASILSPNYSGFGDSYNWIMRYCPDSMYAQFGPAGSEKVTDLYQGISPNPAQASITDKPNLFWGGKTMTVRLRSTTENWYMNTPSDGPYFIQRKDTSISLRIAARAQGRYFVRSGGRNSNVGDGGGNGGDGPGGDATCRLRRPILTYPEQCLMLAYLSVEDGTSYGGKSAAQWYEDGVKAAIQEIYDDALAAKIQICVNPANIALAPKIPGINAAGVYEVTPAMVTNYLAGYPFPGAQVDQLEAIVGQAWIYHYKRPEEMWGWWKLTGFPKILSIATPADRVNGKPYLMQPYINPAANSDNSITSTPLSFVRRNQLPQPLTENQSNFEEARAALVGTAGYGQFTETTGRIWWDVNLPR